MEQPAECGCLLLRSFAFFLPFAIYRYAAPMGLDIWGRLCKEFRLVMAGESPNALGSAPIRGSGYETRRAPLSQLSHESPLAPLVESGIATSGPEAGPCRRGDDQADRKSR